MKKSKKAKRTKIKQTIAAWRAECQEYADQHEALALGEIWDGDPYELMEPSKDAFKSGQSPSAFIDEMFAEDIARQEHESQQAEEALDYESEYESEDE